MQYKAKTAADRHAEKRIKLKKQKIAIMIACGLLALVLISVFISVILTSCSHNTAVLTPSSQLAADLGYNPNDTVIDVEKYASTVLAESEDAGQDYIDNTLFIGDSNTYRMMAYGFTTLSNDIGIIGMGVQQVPLTKCVFFEGYSDPVTIPEAVKIMQPERIIISFGTNNTVGWTPETFIADYKKAVDAIKLAYPAADIIINSIPPVNRLQDGYNISMSTVDAFNLELVKFAEREGYKFLNSIEVLRDSTGYAKDQYTINDGIHLTKKAFTDMFNYIRTHSYITEDDRPKPLSKIPRRAETEPYIISSDPHYVYGQSSSASSSSGIYRTVTFKVNDPAMGTISGTLKQEVYEGEKCEKVTAVAAEGYKFSHWGCTVGSIPDIYNKELTFNPPVWTNEDVEVIAYFEKDTSSSSSQISSSQSAVSSSQVISSSAPSSSSAPASSSTPASSSQESSSADTSSEAPPETSSDTSSEAPPETSSQTEPSLPDTSAE